MLYRLNFSLASQPSRIVYFLLCFLVICCLPAQAEIQPSSWVDQAQKKLQQEGFVELSDPTRLKQPISQSEFAALVDRVIRQSAMRVEGGNHRVKNFTVVPGEPPAQEAQISRARAVDVLVRSFGFERELQDFASRYETNFKDITTHHPYYAAILLAEKTNLIDGYPDQTFRPDDPLPWADALAMVETMHRWTLAMPETAPTWVTKAQERKNMMHNLLGGFRVVMTLCYLFLAGIVFIRFWNLTKRQKSRYQSLGKALILMVISMAIMWIGEVLANYGVVSRSISHLFALFSIVAAIALLRVGQILHDSPPADPGQDSVHQKTPLIGYILTLNPDKGEIEVADPINQQTFTIQMGGEAQIFHQHDNGVEKIFFSDLRAGDLLNIKGQVNSENMRVNAQSIWVMGNRKQQQGLPQHMMSPLYLEALSKQRAQQHIFQPRRPK